MELGGNAPFLVFDDADLDAAVDGAMIAKMRNGGEACTAANRLYVQAGIAADFTAALTERMAALAVGPGLQDGINVGPLVNAESRDKVAELVDDAIAKGAVATTGGTTPDGTGWFYPPTVLIDVPADALILREEIFGPVAPIVVFDTEEQAIALANDTEYGLVAYLYTTDLARGLRVSEALESGMIGLNRGPRLRPRRTLRRRQAIRPRPRRRPRRTPGIPRKQIHRPVLVTVAGRRRRSQRPRCGKSSGWCCNSMRVRRMWTQENCSASTRSRRRMASSRRACSALTTQRRWGPVTIMKARR